MDPKNVSGSIGFLADQCQYIWDLSESLQFENKYGQAENIILCAMGGSVYGAYVVQNLYKNELKVPLISHSDYNLPGFADKNSLVILSSYSGGTEEPLSAAKEAIDKGFPIIGLSGGGEVSQLAKKDHFPALIFDTKYNPSGQPRLGTGYMVLGTIAISTRFGYLSIPDSEVEEAIMERRAGENRIQDQAKELAKELIGFIPIYIAAEFLNGNIHIIRNQTNETAKSFAGFSELPELNHHLMEGLKNPPAKKLMVVFLESSFYSDKLKIRLDLTKDVVSKNNIEHLSYRAPGKSKLSQMLNVLSFGSYLTYYLAMLYHQDPSVIPWVDYFKEQLDK